MYQVPAQGDVDTKITGTLWKSLTTHLHEEDTRSMLPVGRAGLTSKELSMIQPHFVENVLASAGSANCPFCLQGRESRFHWRHECTQSQDRFLQLYQAVSKELARGGPAFWLTLTMSCWRPSRVAPSLLSCLTW